MSLENIISKYLLNKTDHLELEQLKAWQAEAQDNVQALEDMQKIFSLDMSGYKSYNTQDAWGKIESQLSEDEPESSETKVFQLKRWVMSGAAIIALLLATTFVWQKYTVDSYDTHYATTNTKQSANLPDQSIVTLDKGTTLDIISDDFGKDRALSLSGRAFFDVAKDKQHPFTVSLHQGKITVLGTQFSINTTDKVEEIYVTEGHVRYDIADRSFDLRAGDFIKVLDGDVIKVAMNDVNYLSWKNGKLILNDVNVSTAIKNLSNHYKANISLSADVDVTNCKISTTLDQETLDEALEELAILFSLEYKKVGDQIIISQINC